MYDDPVKDDFRNFMFLAFEVMGIEPHDIQYDVADWLQNASNRRILSCMRGFGKTVMIACYIAWRFHQNPNRLLLVQSASSERAKEIVALVRQILGELEITAHLVPDGRDKNIRNQAQRFDIAIRTRKSKDPSLAAYGHRSMVTGSHVDEIITDDLETTENSLTDDNKRALMEKIAEYEDIVIADTDNIVTLIGTPQTQESIYFAAEELGYEMIRVPARYPALDDEFIDTIPTFLRDKITADPDIVGLPTYPERMDEEYLANKESITPPARFQLQMMLNPALADADRYPLRLRDLIVFDCDLEMFPARLSWTNEEAYRKPIPVAGWRGDYLYGPRTVDDELVPFNRKVMWIDPSGRGADSCTFCVGYAAPSYIYIPEIGGHVDAFNEQLLTRMAVTALKHDVQTIFIEENYNGGAYAELLKPVLRRFGVQAGVEPVWVTGRKESRLIDLLRPVMGTHRLVVSSEVAKHTELQYQLTHIWDTKDALEHDDYVDALWGCVSRLTQTLNRDFMVTIEDQKEKRLKAVVDDFWEKMGDPIKRTTWRQKSGLRSRKRR